MSKSKFNKFLISIFFCIYIFFSVQIPWINNSPIYLDLDPFQYEYSLDSGLFEYRLKYNYNSFKDYVLNEWLWNYTNNFFSKFNISGYFLFFVFYPFLIYYFNTLTLMLNGKARYHIFLFYPYFLLFYFNQLRLAFAISISVFLFYFFRKHKLVWLIILIPSLIHTSILIFGTVMYLLNRVILLKINNLYKIILCVFLGLLCCYLTGPVISDILLLLGDRRFDLYDGSTWQSSLSSSIFWLFILVILIIDVLKKQKIDFEQSVSICFLSLTVFSVFFIGGYPYRYFSATFIFLILAISKMNFRMKISTYILLFIGGLFVAKKSLGWF